MRERANGCKMKTNRPTEIGSNRNRETMEQQQHNQNDTVKNDKTDTSAKMNKYFSQKYRKLLAHFSWWFALRFTLPLARSHPL